MRIDSSFIDNIKIEKGADYEAEFVEVFDLTDLDIIATIFDKDTKIADFVINKIDDNSFTMKIPRSVTAEISIGEYNYSCHLVGETISPAFLEGKVFVSKKSDLS